MPSIEAPFAVIICHGSYHTPEPYQPFLSALKAQGIEAYCPQLPSSDLSKMNVGDIKNPDYDREPPPNGYPQPTDDAVVLNELLNELITKSDKNVILIGHSAGAFTASMVAVPDFQAKTRKAKGASGGIIGIFFECGFLIPVGESTHTFFQPKDGSESVIPPYCQFHVGTPKYSLALPSQTSADKPLTLETRLRRRRLHKGRHKVLLQWPRRRHGEILRDDLDSLRESDNSTDQ